MASKREERQVCKLGRSTAYQRETSLPHDFEEGCFALSALFLVMLMFVTCWEVLA